MFVRIGYGAVLFVRIGCGAFMFVRIGCGAFVFVQIGLRAFVVVKPQIYKNVCADIIVCQPALARAPFLTSVKHPII